MLVNCQTFWKRLAAGLALLALAALVTLPTFAADAAPPAGLAPAATAPPAWITLAVPLVIAALKWFIPRLPSVWLPLLAPALGMLCDWLLSSSHSSPLLAAVAGSAGVGLREIVDQTRKKVVEIESAPFPLIFIPLVLLPIVGCARFGTTQTDNSYDPETGKLIRSITTKAASHTFFESKSALAKWKASQTDKTQGAEVGGLSQDAGPGTNTANLVNSAVGAAVEAAVRAATKK